MSLEHAILVSLAERPATGYALARRFDASIGYFWQATHQQIYKVLRRMEADALVRATDEGRQTSYAITRAGREELAGWCAEPSGREAWRSEFAVKLRAFADAEVIVADTQRRRAAHAERLKIYLDSEKRDFGDPDALNGRELGMWLTLRGGIRTETEGIAWCDEILDRLGAEPTGAVTTAVSARPVSEGPGSR